MPRTPAADAAVPTPLSPTPGQRACDVAVVVASAGRPELLGRLVADLAHQTHRDFALVVCTPGPADLPAAGLPPAVVVVHARGAAAQRNAGIDAVPGASRVFFFDDDAVVRPDYLERALAYFDAHPEVVGITGRVLLDGSGASAGEVDREIADDALRLSAADRQQGAGRPVDQLYGCNFGYRADVDPALRFDERLPLYSWLEDLDFAGCLLRHGSLAKIDDAVVVHLGVKSGGRTAHQRLGYSQVMNPFYLLRKGTISWRRLGYEVGPRLVGNASRSVGHAERSWRRRRLLGNARALADLARGRFTPERILDLPPA
ncbi:glycosyltransferase family 2 protein [Quadrisphaera oryzae]|uniref:glycosyltransferase family 2 protein n=1 Tax=Quadrisphaera TaxID=317661 RepID=UPI0016457860|nr:glycosyltransferase [Quadrisphaera sp. RL12-1S]MBC3761731.1 glycosyltransferase family 2 protein [Quadrisphaera sp. RL12-1S]